jgi:hypothetical protein
VPGHGGEAFEGSITLAEIEKIVGIQREFGLRVALEIDADQAIGPGVREPSEKNALNDAEMALLAPMLRASVNTMIAVNAGVRRRERKA